MNNQTFETIKKVTRSKALNKTAREQIYKDILKEEGIKVLQ